MLRSMVAVSALVACLAGFASLDKLGAEEAKVAANRPLRQDRHAQAERQAATRTDTNTLPAARKLSPEQEALRVKVRKALTIYQAPRLNTRDHSAWEVMHAFIAYGARTQILRDGPRGEPVNACSWLCWGGRCNGEPLLVIDSGRVSARIGPGLQGHAGQFMAMLAQSRIRAENPIQLDGKPFTVADLIAHEKLDCQENTELTFKLIGLAHYLQSDETWTSRDGQTWSIPRLIKEELSQPIRGAACGGTHRLFGLSWAYRTRMKRGEPVDGEYQRAKTYIRDFHRYTFANLQNSDGSFSTEWFTRPANRPDLARKLQTSGHILEWLAFSLSDNQLEDPRMMKAVDFLAGILISEPNRDWAIGPLGHAVHALVMYDERVSKSPAPEQAEILARREQTEVPARAGEEQARESKLVHPLTSSRRVSQPAK